MVKGFAAVSKCTILVNTVSETERAAMVNWLVVYANFLVHNGMGDFSIRENFHKLSSKHEVTIEPVDIFFGS